MKYIKHIIPTVALILSSLLLGNTASSAMSCESNYTCTADPETIQMQKIAFYTSELQLTPKEAEKFWPLYNEYWEARMNAHNEAIKAIHKLKEVLDDSSSEVDDSEIKKLSELYLKNYSAESALLSEYFIKFQKILPIKKAAKIFSTEEKFRRMLIKQLRNKTSQNGGGTPPPPKK